jgi:hypothetical protein
MCSLETSLVPFLIGLVGTSFAVWLATFLLVRTARRVSAYNSRATQLREMARRPSGWRLENGQVDNYFDVVAEEAREIANEVNRLRGIWALTGRK